MDTFAAQDQNLRPHQNFLPRATGEAQEVLPSALADGNPAAGLFTVQDADQKARITSTRDYYFDSVRAWVGLVP